MKLKYLFGACTLSLGLMLNLTHAKDLPNVSVKVASIVQHPALDAVRDGIKERLLAEGFVEGKNLKWEYQNAQGNTATGVQIIRQFVGQKPDVIVAIATPIAQAAASTTKKIPVVFSAITDPVAAGLVKNWEHPGKNVTGVSDDTDLVKQINLIQKIAPKAKRIGVVYNPGEANSVVVVNELKKVLPQYGLKLVTAAAPRSVDVQQASRSLVNKADVFFSLKDNNVVSAYEALVKVANEAHIPLIASDTPSVERGAVAALGVNYRNLGLQTGDMLIRILVDGVKPGDISVETDNNLEMYLNLKAAQIQGVKLPQELVDSATKVFQ